MTKEDIRIVGPTTWPDRWDELVSASTAAFLTPRRNKLRKDRPNDDDPRKEGASLTRSGSLPTMPRRRKAAKEACGAPRVEREMLVGSVPEALLRNPKLAPVPHPGPSTAPLRAATPPPRPRQQSSQAAVVHAQRYQRMGPSEAEPLCDERRDHAGRTRDPAIRSAQAVYRPMARSGLARPPALPLGKRVPENVPRDVSMGSESSLHLMLAMPASAPPALSHTRNDARGVGLGRGASLRARWGSSESEEGCEAAEADEEGGEEDGRAHHHVRRLRSLTCNVGVEIGRAHV